MRGFSDEERRDIEEDLVETARDLFARYGFQKTTVREITEPVGIAESTFYRFFETKSEIYLRVLLREQHELIDAVEAELEGLSDPEVRLERLFRTWVTEFENRPLLVESHRAPQEFVRGAEATDVGDAKRLIAERMLPLVSDVQAECDGFVGDVSPEFVFELLSVLELVAAQQEAHDELGWSGYDAFRENLIAILVGGLLSEGSTT